MSTYSPEQLSAAADRVFRNICQLFSYYSWIAQVAPSLESREKNAPGHRFFVLAQNALVDGFLINLRRLNEFFTEYPEKRNPKFADDLRASDFGFPEKGPFLHSADMDELHKRIAHSTSRAAIQGDASFEALKATELALGHSSQFLKHLCGSLYADDPKKTESVGGALRTLNGWLEAWKNEANASQEDPARSQTAQSQP
jgi:hypothetical protein